MRLRYIRVLNQSSQIWAWLNRKQRSILISWGTMANSMMVTLKTYSSRTCCQLEPRLWPIRRAQTINSFTRCQMWTRQESWAQMDSVDPQDRIKSTKLPILVTLCHKVSFTKVVQKERKRDCSVLKIEHRRTIGQLIQDFSLLISTPRREIITIPFMIRGTKAWFLWHHQPMELVSMISIRKSLKLK